jgi:hypothetical protein
MKKIENTIFRQTKLQGTKYESRKSQVGKYCNGKSEKKKGVGRYFKNGVLAVSVDVLSSI